MVAANSADATVSDPAYSATTPIALFEKMSRIASTPAEEKLKEPDSGCLSVIRITESMVEDEVPQRVDSLTNCAKPGDHAAGVEVDLSRSILGVMSCDYNLF